MHPAQRTGGLGGILFLIKYFISFFSLSLFKLDFFSLKPFIFFSISSDV
jgi:hypothetical protein